VKFDHCLVRSTGGAGIGGYTDARSGNINQSETLLVGNVEHIPAELQLMLLAPRLVQVFASPRSTFMYPGRRMYSVDQPHPGSTAETVVNCFNVAAAAPKKLLGFQYHRPTLEFQCRVGQVWIGPSGSYVDWKSRWLPIAGSQKAKPASGSPVFQR